jgi:hypothetical protein
LIFNSLFCVDEAAQGCQYDALNTMLLKAIAFAY